MTDETPMQQNDNRVTGDLVGRDKTTIYEARHSEIRRLIIRFEKEVKERREVVGVIAELVHYQRPFNADSALDLAEKLRLADRHDQIPVALELKEMFAKLLSQYQLHESSQKLIAFALGMLQAFFDTHVTPEIQQGATRAQVDRVLLTDVLWPVIREMEHFFAPQVIRGATYYLTGNCHLRWDRR